MQIIKTEHYIQFTSTDNNGVYRISIQKDCSQIRVDTEDGDVYIDTNRKELTAIMDCIKEVLDNNK